MKQIVSITKLLNKKKKTVCQSYWRSIKLFDTYPALGLAIIPLCKGVANNFWLQDKEKYKFALSTAVWLFDFKWKWFVQTLVATEGNVGLLEINRRATVEVNFSLISHRSCLF